MKYNCTHCPSVFESKDECMEHIQNHIKQETSGRSRDRSRSPVSHEAGVRGRFSDYKCEEGAEPQGWEERTDCFLDYFNSDLHLIIKGDGCSAEPLIGDGFNWMWAGARCTQGLRPGYSTWYEVRVTKHLDIGPSPDERVPHVLRLGWSSNASGMILGEEPDSYGYGGTGKAAENQRFTDYGCKFGAGDVIAAILDWSSGVARMSFAVNGKTLGQCFQRPARYDSALFPHIFTKNCSFEVNFGQRQPWYPLPELSRTSMITGLPSSARMSGQKSPQKREDCTVLMLCGLPASGKSVWAEKFASERVLDRYTVLGTNALIDRFKVTGLPRNRNYAGRWDMLIEKSNKCMNKLLKMAAHRKRNFILDQTNVYPTARRRKMAPFSGFHRICVCFVPDHSEWLRRCKAQKVEEGKDVPESAFVEMKANFQLPRVGDGQFDEVWWPELPEREASLLVERYNQEGIDDKRSGKGDSGKFAGRGRGRGGDCHSRGGQHGDHRQRYWSGYSSGGSGGPPKSDFGYSSDNSGPPRSNYGYSSSDQSYKQSGSSNYGYDSGGGYRQSNYNYSGQSCERRGGGRGYNSDGNRNFGNRNRDQGGYSYYSRDRHHHNYKPY